MHCCPWGFTCKEGEGKCERSSSSMGFSSFYLSILEVPWEDFTRKKAQKLIPSTNSTNLCSLPPSTTPTHRCPLNYSCCHDHSGHTPVCCDQDVSDVVRLSSASFTHAVGCIESLDRCGDCRVLLVFRSVCYGSESR